MQDENVRLLSQFINDINLIQPEFSFSDRLWRLSIRFGLNPRDWTMVHITLYENTYYCYWTEWDLSLELSMTGNIKKPAFWDLSAGDSRKFSYMLTSFTTVVKRITNDWLRVYRETLKNLPLDMRYGILPKGVIWKYYPDWYRADIDLGVTKKADGWSVFLRGSSTSRMAETIRIALVLVKEGLPVEIHDAEELSLRLLGMDNTGIIPKFIINHRASQNFEKGDRVYDCAHLNDFSRKNRVLPFINWKPIDPLRPRIV